MAPKPTSLSLATERRLAEAMADCYADPLRFVRIAFPWGQPTLPDGSLNPLRNSKGPEPWQETFLRALGDHIQSNSLAAAMGEDLEVWKSAVASGHGVGKSAMMSWLILFFMSTRVDVRGIVTANTLEQLTGKTWPELSKWQNLCLVGHWFEWTSTALRFAAYPDNKKKNYSFQAVTVASENTEAFAGLHNAGRTVVIMKDEASAIDSRVWEVAEGALSDGEGFLITAGNPTLPSGRFFECFHRYKKFYYTMKVDAREVSHTNKKYLQEQIEKYGYDSAPVRIRIRGEFPIDSVDGFFPSSLISEATAREVGPEDTRQPLIMGVDVGEVHDRTVVIFRRGLDARSLPIYDIENQRNDTMAGGRRMSPTETAYWLLDIIEAHKPDALCIENSGAGIGVIAVLKMMNAGTTVCPIFPGSPPASMRSGTDGRSTAHPSLGALDPQEARMQWGNERARLHNELREWLYEGGCIADHPLLVEQLKDCRAVQGANSRGDVQFIEAKSSTRARRMKVDGYTWTSPDFMDALVFTFGVRPFMLDSNQVRARARGGQRANFAKSDYDIFGS